ncbi:MAG: MFS transporter [Candidatus Saccharibacteria bacterium]|nr:MFS transporter [Candidatus Saccharibacteria bacterium]
MSAKVENASTKLEKRALPIVLFTVFLDVLGVGILIPVLPQLIFTIFEPAGFSRNNSLILLGWLTAIYPLMQFLATPILGQLSDRYGRRKVLGFSLAGTAFGYALFAVGIVTKNIPLLFFARGLDGITGGNLSVARAVVADVSTPNNRTRNFGLIGACFGLGFVFGPYIGARLASPLTSFFGLFNTPHWFGPSTPFWFTAILSTINVILLWIYLPETHMHINAKLKLAWNKSLDNIKQAALSPSLRVVFAANFLFWGGFTFFTTFFQILLIEKLHFKQANIGDFFAYIGIWIVISQGVLTPLLARFKNSSILRVSFLGLGFALLLQLFPNNTTQLLMVAPFIAIFNGLNIANATALISSSVGPEIQGEVLGIDGSIQALAGAIPAIMSGYVATLGINMPVIVGGITIIAGGLIFNIFYREPKAKIHQVV